MHNINQEAEQAILGILLLYPANLDKVDLDVRDFYYTQHRHIYLAIRKLAEAHDTVDSISVSMELRRVGQLEQTGGEDYIDSLCNACTGPELLASYCASIRELAEARRIAEGAQRVLALAASDILDTPSLLEAAKTLSAYAEASPYSRNGKAHDPSIPSCSVTDQPVNWLWKNRIAAGMLHLLAGEAGTGKSAATLDLAARVSAGKAWPTESIATRTPRDVLLISAEDDHARTVGPRLSVAGADRSRIHFIQDIQIAGKTRSLSIIDHTAYIASAIRAHNCALCIIDPVSSFLGSAEKQVDSHSNTDIRDALMPLHSMAAETHCAILLVTHLNKGQGKAIHRVIGSVAFVALCRVAFVAVKDRENPCRRLWLPIKNNLAEDRTGFAYSLSGAPTDLGDIVAVTWETDPIDDDADEAVEITHRGKQPDASNAALAYLQDALKAGALYSVDVIDGRPDGVSSRTLKRAKQELGVISTKSTDGRWLWSLPAGDEEYVPF